VPHLVKEILPADRARRADLNLENVAKVIYGMYGVVNEGGTGAGVHMPGLDLCGKTGTAQLASNDVLKGTELGRQLKDNAWFVGFAPRQNPEIVVVALFEGGMHGDRAGPIVRDVVKAYFDKKLRIQMQQQQKLAQSGVPSLAASFARPQPAPAPTERQE
jgi:penicillin-binding protein 2